MLEVMPSQEYLHECLEYFPLTGALVWRERPLHHFKDKRAWKIWNTKFAGFEAFTQINKGYYRGTLQNTNYLAHRIIFKMLHGWEPEQIDHDDRNTLCNAAHNLKASGVQNNAQNRGILSCNTSGVTGVCWVKSRNKWRVTLSTKFIGEYTSFDDAVAARKQALQDSGYHINHGV